MSTFTFWVYCHLPRTIKCQCRRNTIMVETQHLVNMTHRTMMRTHIQTSKKTIWKAIINSSHLLVLCVCRLLDFRLHSQYSFSQVFFFSIFFSIYFVYLSLTSLSKTINVPHFFGASKISHFLSKLIKFKQKFVLKN